MNFFDKLEAAIAEQNSLLCVSLDPSPDLQQDLADIEGWLAQVIEQTAEFVCLYKPTLGFYQALGVGGWALLQRTLARIPGHLPVLLDVKHSDINTSTVLAATFFEELGVDAVTLNAYAGQELVAPFLVYPGRAVFVLCHSSNPSSRVLQEYPSTGLPLYQHFVKEVRGWGSPAQVGLEVGAAVPETLAQIRALAPERVLLIRGLWREGADLERTLAAGLDQDGKGLLLPTPQAFLMESDRPQAFKNLQHRVNQARTQRANTCSLWSADVCLLEQTPQVDLILQLFDMGCILFGEFVQASGAVFPYYVDLRTIISHPQVFHLILRAYGEILEQLTFDRIAGIPYGSLPTAAGLALRLHRPMVFPRKEVKAHGTRRVIEGHYEPGETVVVVDDILISGKSAMEGCGKLESVGLRVQDVVVLIDHGHGVKERLGAAGYQAHAVLTMAQIVKTLFEAERITEAQYRILEC